MAGCTREEEQEEFSVCRQAASKDLCPSLPAEAGSSWTPRTTGTRRPLQKKDII